MPLYLLVVMLILTPLTANAATVSSYNIAAHTDSSVVALDPANIWSASGLTSSNISYGTGVMVPTGTWYDGGAFCVINWVSNQSSPAPDEYMQVSLAPDPGNTLNLDAVEFSLAREHCSGGSCSANVRVSYNDLTEWPIFHSRC